MEIWRQDTMSPAQTLYNTTMWYPGTDKRREKKQENEKK